MQQRQRAIFSMIGPAILLVLAGGGLQAAENAAKERGPNHKLVGEWRGTDLAGETASLVFAGNGSARFILDENVLDDEAAQGKVTWELDESHDPSHLDIIVTRGEEQMRFPMIVRFLSSDRIELRMSMGELKRPMAFAEGGQADQVILTRQP